MKATQFFTGQRFLFVFDPIKQRIYFSVPPGAMTAVDAPILFWISPIFSSPISGLDPSNRFPQHHSERTPLKMNSCSNGSPFRNNSVYRPSDNSFHSLSGKLLAEASRKGAPVADTQRSSSNRGRVREGQTTMENPSCLNRVHNSIRYSASCKYFLLSTQITLSARSLSNSSNKPAQALLPSSTSSYPSQRRASLYTVK